MTEKLPPFIAEVNDALKAAEVFLSITRDSELQKEAVESLEQMMSRIAAEKEKAIGAKEEDYANMLLGCECVAEALVAEIKMWLLLKEGDPDGAWDQLVNAQTAAIAAMHAHDGFGHLEYHNERYRAIEQLVFPKQIFVSSGMIVRSQECSICGKEYEDCDHLIRRPYMGKFCCIIARDLEFDHVAIVDEPADKRCRMQHFSVEGGYRNRMTWRITTEEDGT